VILTRTRGLPRLNKFTFAPITRTIRRIESEVLLGPGDGLPSDCAASLDNIGTAPKGLLDRRIATLSDARMEQVFDAIRFAFEMPR
jgi:mRNA-degrading endonuclease toxin of MazEF toxin-antitoxin module